MGQQSPARGPDFSLGLASSEIADGASLAGRVGDQPAILSRRGDNFFAVSGSCTHYGGLLADGLIESDRVHCPLHHACFSLRTGEALTAPAFDALARWRVDVEGEQLFVRQQLPQASKRDLPHTAGSPQCIVIVGGGAAGFAAAEMLRRQGFAGSLTLLSADPALPCDRPNLSKDYLAGTAPEDWIPLKGEDFYRDNDIDLRLGVNVSAIDRRRKELTAGNERLPYDALLLATGSTPIRLAGPGLDAANVHVLRSLADSRAIIASAAGARTVAVIGASFIGLEVAAALRARGLEVHVIAPDKVPLQRVLGDEIGKFVRRVHEEHGVVFHLGLTAERYSGRQLRLSDGATINADFVVLGVGVRPNVQLAVEAGLAVDGGVIVDDGMRTSDPAIFAAGDIAKYRDALTHEIVRVEHWVAAERQGQLAALSMLGKTGSFPDPPFFWSAHYDHVIRYVGHAVDWDSVEIDGPVGKDGFTARYLRKGRLLAVATLGRDRASLEAHQELAAMSPTAA